MVWPWRAGCLHDKTAQLCHQAHLCWIQNPIDDCRFASAPVPHEENVGLGRFCFLHVAAQPAGEPGARSWRWQCGANRSATLCMLHGACVWHAPCTVLAASTACAHSGHWHGPHAAIDSERPDCRRLLADKVSSAQTRYWGSLDAAALRSWLPDGCCTPVWGAKAADASGQAASAS